MDVFARRQVGRKRRPEPRQKNPWFGLQVLLTALLILCGAYQAEGEEKPLRMAMSGEYLPLHREVLSPAGAGKPVHPYVVTQSTSAHAAANAGTPVLSRLEPGDLVDSRQPAEKAGSWVETSVGGKRAWVSADHVVDLTGPFFSVSRIAPEADPDQPCVDGPCGCYVYKPIPENTVTLTPAGKRLLTGKFGAEAVRNPSVDTRRRMAQSILRALLGAEMKEIISRREAEQESIAVCWQGCRVEEGESDGCCDCPEQERYTGFTEAFAAIGDLAESFFSDPDPEVQRRVRLALCAFLREHPHPDLLFTQPSEANQLFQICDMPVQ